MKKTCYPLCFLAILCLCSCVSRQSYNELEEQLSYYKGEALGADSVNVTNQNLSSSSQQLEVDLYKKNTTIEQMRATNISLNRSYQDILQRYNTLLDQSQATLTTSSYEQVNLREQLSSREAEIDRKERELEQLEFRLRAREDELRRVESNGGTTNLGTGDPSLRRAQLLADTKADRMRRLRSTLLESFGNYPRQDMIIDEVDGTVLVSLSPRLFFGNNTDALSPQGQQLLQQFVRILNQYADVSANILGAGQDYGVNRAINILNTMLSMGFAPDRVDMSAQTLRSSQQVGVPARVKILLSPGLIEVYDELRN